MATQLAAAPPFLGNPAGGEMMASQLLPSDQLERRRKAASRWAWGLGLLVLLLYLGGLFIKR